MIFMERDGDSIILRAGLMDKDRAKQVPGARHDNRARVWRYPLSWATCVVARGVFGDELEIGPELVEWATKEKATRIDPATSLSQLSVQELDRNGA